MKPHRLPSSCIRAASFSGGSSSSKFVSKARSGKSNFEKDFEKSHIRTNLFQKILLGLGSGVVSITSPNRGDMIAVMGEVTGYQAFEYVRSKMTESDEGRKILEEKPRISSSSIDLEKLKSFPEGTLGKAYSNFLVKYGYSPDTRNAVQFVDEMELAYVAQRYRESHDLFHTLLDMPTNMLGEVAVKWVEAIQFKLPMCATGALFGAMRLAPKFSRAYSTKHIIKLDSSLTERIESKDLKPKRHPGVMHLPCICLPEDILSTIRDILSSSRKHLQPAAYKFQKTWFHRVLPMESCDKKRMLNEFYEYYKSKIPPNVEITEHLEDEIMQKALKRLSTIANHWKPFKYDKKLSLTYLMARASAEYAILKRVFNEIRLRDKDFEPESLLDFGSGIGTVNWVAHELWGSSLREYYCVDASGDMNELAAMILRKNNINNQPFIKNVYYRQFFPGTPRLFDIVVSSFTFFEFPSCQDRLRMITSLWNDTKEYLVLIENGTNWGFQVISEARDFLLRVSKTYDVDCHVFAPCPHDEACPRLTAEGNKTPCTFFIQYRKFSFTSSEEVNGERFCFVIFRKKPKPETLDRPCRVVREVLKRHKHVVCRLCTTEGKLLNLFVTSSKHGKPAYQCMRVSKWGDLVPGVLEPKMIESHKNPLIPDSDTGELISDSDSDSDSDSESISESNVGSDLRSESHDCSDVNKEKNK